MRLSARSRVDFPQPEGPISAVTALAAKGMATSYSAWFLP